MYGPSSGDVKYRSRKHHHKRPVESVIEPVIIDPDTFDDDEPVSLSAQEICVGNCQKDYKGCMINNDQTYCQKKFVNCQNICQSNS